MSIQYLRTLPLTDALFWYIENVGDEAPDRNAMFFHLRERVREQPSGGVLAVMATADKEMTRLGFDHLTEARAAVAELIEAAARVHALNHTQGVTEDEWEQASAALDAALARMGGSQ